MSFFPIEILFGFDKSIFIEFTSLVSLTISSFILIPRL